MEEALVKRIMPNSLEAEQSVIGSMIMDKDAIVTAMGDAHQRGLLPHAVRDFV